MSTHYEIVELVLEFIDGPSYSCLYLRSPEFGSMKDSRGDHHSADYIFWSFEIDEFIFSHLKIESTLVISKSKEPDETLRDIRTSTYQMCRIEEHTKRTTKFHK